MPLTRSNRTPAGASLLCLALASLAVCLACATAHAAPRLKPIWPPEIYLTWNAPVGEERSASNIVVDCSDTTASDTLYLTFRTSHNVVPLTGMTGTLLFEPQAGDTLGSFWDMERGGTNSGSLLIDFDKPGTLTCSHPFIGVVGGHVGYSRAGGRGRLDLSADVIPERSYKLVPSGYYLFARVTIRRLHGGLAGCSRPMRITWIGGRLRSTRPGSESVAFSRGPGRSVTRNARSRGVTARGTRLAVETWVPRVAPPSWKSMPIFPGAAPDSTPER